MFGNSMKKILFTNTDKLMVSGLKKGDEQAFADLFQKYSKKIYAVSRKLQLGHQEAEEVVQEVFLKIWRNRTNLDEDLSFNSYILTVAKSVVFKFSRKKAYHLAYEKYALSRSLAYDNQTEDYVVFSDMEAFSQKCLDNLPPQQRQVFMMKTRDNFSIDEISAELNLSKRTVENHFYRACKELKQQLVEHKIISATKMVTPFLFFLLG